MSTFEDGIVRAIERTLGQESDRSRFSQRRIYLRSLHFSGCEDIFPRSDFPFFCNIFARLIPNAAAPVKISILADKPYVRSVLGSHLGSSKCAVNYTRMVELDLLCKHPPAMQRLWVSNSTGFPIEELDTMAIGFMGAGGEFILPPKSAGKLPSITLARLTQKLLEEGQVVRSEAVGLSELREHLASGAIVGIFAVSTGKGLAIAEQIQIGDELLRIVTPNDRIEALWHTFTRIYKEPAGARLPTLQ